MQRGADTTPWFVIRDNDSVILKKVVFLSPHHPCLKHGWALDAKKVSELLKNRT